MGVPSVTRPPGVWGRRAAGDGHQASECHRMWSCPTAMSRVRVSLLDRGSANLTAWLNCLGSLWEASVCRHRFNSTWGSCHNRPLPPQTDTVLWGWGAAIGVSKALSDLKMLRSLRAAVRPRGPAASLRPEGWGRKQRPRAPCRPRAQGPNPDSQAIPRHTENRETLLQRDSERRRP